MIGDNIIEMLIVAVIFPFYLLVLQNVRSSQIRNKSCAKKCITQDNEYQYGK